MVASVVTVPRLVIAGSGSAVGKTTVTVALCREFRRRGLRVAVFKCGPDYLDPTFHRLAAGVRSLTLDGWMMGHDGVLRTFESACRDADIAVIEGVMGLYDGVDPTSNHGSTAEIAEWLEAPVLLVLDVSGMARSAAAMVNGFTNFDPACRIAGVVGNRVGSRGHLELLRAACPTPPFVGGFPKDPAHAFPERHLGLRTAEYARIPDATFDVWAQQASEWCDTDAILAVARTAGELPHKCQSRIASAPVCQIGIARDEAFHFYYDENLRLLQDAGAELIEFSPIHSRGLPALDGLYVGGGYPEVYAAALADNARLRDEILGFCRSGKPVYAECGGLMYLCDRIRDLDGAAHEMVGWFPAEAVMKSRLQALGYVEASTLQDTILGPAGLRFRGHQFRYSDLEWHGNAEHVYRLCRRRNGEEISEGFCANAVLGSYVHAHWASNPEIPKAFVTRCGASSLKR